MSATHVMETEPAVGLPNKKLGMWVFLCSEVMFFTGLIGGYIVLRYGSAMWPVPSTILNVPLTALNTFILICSSVTMVLALSAAQRREQLGDVGRKLEAGEDSRHDTCRTCVTCAGANQLGA